MGLLDDLPFLVARGDVPQAWGTPQRSTRRSGTRTVVAEDHAFLGPILRKNI